MGTSLSKTQLLTELRNEQAAWEALLDEIGEAHMTQQEVAGGCVLATWIIRSKTGTVRSD